MGEAVDDDRAVLVDEQLGLAGAVVDPVDRVGQRLAVVPCRVGHHVVDSDGPQLIVVELERPCRPTACAWPGPP